jgi:hypothetical protein
MILLHMLMLVVADHPVLGQRHIEELVSLWSLCDILELVPVRGIVRGELALWLVL